MQASTYVPKARRMLLFLAPLSSIYFWPASTLLRGHLVAFFSFNFRTFFGQLPRCFATLSPPETGPQILERWNYADEVHLGKSVRAKDFGLECERDVQRLS